jgi:hypothetical protein
MHPQSHLDTFTNDFEAVSTVSGSTCIILENNHQGNAFHVTEASNLQGDVGISILSTLSHLCSPFMAHAFWSFSMHMLELRLTMYITIELFENSTLV